MDSNKIKLGDVIVATCDSGYRGVLVAAYRSLGIGLVLTYANVPGRTMTHDRLSDIRLATEKERETGEIDPDAEPRNGPSMDEPTEIGATCVVTFSPDDDAYIASRASDDDEDGPWWVIGVGWCRWDDFTSARHALRVERETGKPLNDRLASGIDVTDRIESLSENVIFIDSYDCLWKRDGLRFRWWITGRDCWSVVQYDADFVRQFSPLTIATDEQMKAKKFVEEEDR